MKKKNQLPTTPWSGEYFFKRWKMVKCLDYLDTSAQMFIAFSLIHFFLGDFTNFMCIFKARFLQISYLFIFLKILYFLWNMARSYPSWIVIYSFIFHLLYTVINLIFCVRFLIFYVTVLRYDTCKHYSRDFQHSLALSPCDIDNYCRKLVWLILN